MERESRCGAYLILKSMEVGTTVGSAPFRYNTADPNCRILSRNGSRDTHF